MNIIVNNNDDTDDGQCDGRHCSLREAINFANAVPGPDLIIFNTGPTTIFPTSVLPPLIDDGTIIRGEDQIVIDGSNLQDFHDDSLVIRSSYNKIQGLTIRNFGGSGVHLQTTIDYPHADFNVIGVDGSGRNDFAEGNVINNNGRCGVRLDTKFEQSTTVDHNVIAGNIIGLNGGGTVPQPNKHGVLIYQRASYNRIGTDFDGISDGLERNTISGNEGHGVGIYADGISITVAGNFIGTDVTGRQPLGNDDNGVAIYYTAHAAVRGNVISDNGNNGVAIAGSTHNKVLGNKIGTDVTGIQDFGNGRNGIGIFALPNSPAAYNQVGFAGNCKEEFVIEPNAIAFNVWNGIFLPSHSEEFNTYDNAFLYNLIFENDLMGIELVSELCPEDACTDGVTFNDPNDTDGGANGALNYPTIDSVQADGNKTYITASINGGMSDSAFIIQFFANPAPDATGYGEGAVYLGQTLITTDSSGNGSSGLLTFNTPTPVGHFVSSTAILHNNWGPIATSEFSASIEVAQKLNSLSSEKWKQINDILNGLFERGDADPWAADLLLYIAAIDVEDTETALWIARAFGVVLQKMAFEEGALPQEVGKELLELTDRSAEELQTKQRSQTRRG